MKRPIYYLLCAIACTSMVCATMPMAAVAEAIQPQAAAVQQAQADATSSDTAKAEEGTDTNAAADAIEDGTATSTGTSAVNTERADGATAAATTATTAPTPSLRAQTNPAPVAISTTSQTTYAHSATATQNGVTFTVSWNDAPAGTATTFHVTQANGSSQAKARMDVPTYWDGGSQESVCDPSRPAWSGYYSLGTAGHDFTFDFTASGTYRINFYFMDNDRNDPQNDKGIYYLRATAEVTVNDAARPSVTQIVNSAVAQCRQETNGSEYDMALWLHDWTLDQLEYDHSLNWCSAESGLTRHQGTCESYQRIYSKLLDAAGIANGRITGNGHTWNAVKIDGKWCQMDLTWDDTSDNWYGDLDQRHLYFGLTDELMAIAHSDHTANYQKAGYAYRSTDLSNNYFVRNGKADEWAEKYADRIQQHLDAKEESFSIDADNQSFPPSISGIQNGIVAYAMNQKEWITADTKAALFAASVVATSPNGRWATSFLFKTTYLEPPARLEGEYRIALAMAPSMCVSAAASGSSLSRWGSGLSIEPDAGSGLYRIKAADGRALTAVGRAAALRNADGTDSQLWSLTETDGGYVVGSRSTGMVLDSRRAGTSEGNEVRLEWANGTGAQVWNLAEPPARLEGEYRIALAMAPSMCVSAAASGSSLSRWGSGLSIEPDAGSGLYRIKAADGRALTAVGRAAALRNADGTDSQLWSLTETDGGYVVGSRSTGMVLDSRRAGTSEGNEVRLEWANGTGAQVWILLLVS
ncbi:RICIN domain-containing protein [Collinsella aerofaciens]|uniref:RICIN domain-containing protein n=1 Tax=Collinsella aerofaciens TaxID=74426 RepID=UPI0035618EF6